MQYCLTAADSDCFLWEGISASFFINGQDQFFCTEIFHRQIQVSQVGTETPYRLSYSYWCVCLDSYAIQVIPAGKRIKLII